MSGSCVTNSLYPVEGGNGVSTLQPERDFEELITSTVHLDYARWSIAVFGLCLSSHGRLQHLGPPSAFQLKFAI